MRFLVQSIWAFLLSAIALISVQAVAADRCVSSEEVRAGFSASEGGDVTIMVLHQAKRIRAILVIDRGMSEFDSASWQLWRSQGETFSDTFCPENGQKSQVLRSIEDNQFEERFGLPGEGFPRCSLGTDKFGSVKVRGWANRELGPAFVENFVDGTGSFTVLVSTSDFRWILLENRNGRSCYLDRGDTMTIHNAVRR